MADLPGGRYPQVDALWSMLGQPANLTQSNVPAFSNARAFGLGNPTDGALAATDVAVAVPIPVDYGAVISKVSILIGATAGGTMTHQFAALYSGITVPALLGQSTDTTSAAIAASGLASWTLTTPQLVTSANAPNGYIYASLCITASTIPTAASISIPTAIDYKWFTNGPLGFSLTHGSSLAGVAPATITGQAAKAVAPLVFLT